MINLFSKKIAILGFGIEGQSLVNFLLGKDNKIIVFDQKDKEKLKGIQDFEKKGVSFTLGKDFLKKGLKDFDFVFRSPSFKLSLPEIKEAKKAGVIISSATKLFFDSCKGKIIGVTGSKGKGTTSTLIYNILKEQGFEVFLGGNIGTPILSLLPKLKETSWVVLELSSFQLQDLKKSPHIAVVLFITSEHLDYHETFDEYIKAKENIVIHQGKDDYVVINADNKDSLSFSKKTKAKKFFFSKIEEVEGSYVKGKEIFFKDTLIGKTDDLKLIGRHNLENVCAAITASFLAKAGLAVIKKVVFSFSGLEHRLEKVRSYKGISFYNDSFSTMPDASIAAIRSFENPFILIAGGSEKNADFTNLGKEIAKSKVKSLILIGQTAKKIKESILKAGFKGKIIEGLKNMEEIVNRAFEEAEAGDIVLLSPGCAAFGMFEDYKDRGHQFKKYVKSL